MTCLASGVSKVRVWYSRTSSCVLGGLAIGVHAPARMTASTTTGRRADSMRGASELAGVVRERLHPLVAAELDHHRQRLLSAAGRAGGAARTEDENRPVCIAARIRRLGRDLVVDPGLVSFRIARDDVRRPERRRDLVLREP